MKQRFEGRVAVVTGAARGIGRAICQVLAAQGARVAALDLLEDGAKETAAMVQEAGGTALAIPCDVTSGAAVEAAIASTVHQFGRIDILVNNAGLMREMPLATMTEEQWDSEVDVNLKSAFLCSKAVAPHMVKQGSGRIVMTASRAVLGSGRHSAYSAAKAGVVGLTASLAWELGPNGITVNAVAPGHTTTELTRGMAERAGMDYESFKKSRIPTLAVRYVADPVDIANIVAFFASDESRFVTGQTLFATGRPHM